MATLLYRLGVLSASRPWTVLVTWLLLLVAGVAAFLGFGGTLVSTITIPNTETDRVTNRLTQEFPDAAQGMGGVVFTTDNGEEFTDQQHEAISQLLDEVSTLEGVDSVINPFEAAQEQQQAAEQLREGAQQLQQVSQQVEQGTEQIQQAEEELAASQQELDAAQQEVDAGRQAALDAGLSESAADAQVAQAQAQVDEGKEQLEQAQQQIAEQKQELEQGRQQIVDSEASLVSGESLLQAAENYRLISEDGSTTEAMVQFSDPDLEITNETRESVVDTLTESNIEGVSVHPTLQISQTIPAILGPTEVVGLVVAAVVLVVMLGSLVAAGLPLLNALIGVGVSITAALAFSSVVEMTSVTPVLGVMLGLAVGIDYALFIINRHRQQLKTGMDITESIGLANGTSGNAVIFAGATVMIALLALNVTGIPFLGLMGTVAALSVLTAVLIAITLTPAMLGVLGPRALSKRERATIAAVARTASAEQATSADPTTPVRPMSTARAVVIALISIGVLVVMAIPALSMRVALPDASAEPQDSDAYVAHQIIEEKFGEGRNGPLVVTVDLPEGLSDPEILATEAEVAQQLVDLDSVDSVVSGGENSDATVAMFQVIPTAGPTAEATENLVEHLRGLQPDGEAENLAVIGMTSGAIDVSEALAEKMPLYLGVVVGLSLVIMVVVFRSLIVPLIATGGFVLSVFAAMGAVVAIYQWGWLGEVFQVHSPGPVLAFLPILMIGIMFGLAMDYQLFISTGMREAFVHGDDARTAVMRGYRLGRAVVVAAAIIMVAVFGGFIYAESAMIRPIGFGLAFGVLIDAFVIRLLVVPALMHLVGAGAWWLPGWLDKILPNVDVEGSSLTATVDDVDDLAHHTNTDQSDPDQPRVELLEEDPDDR